MNHHLQSLGWTLVHFCWQAAAIALVYSLAGAQPDPLSARTGSHAPDACERIGYAHL